MSFADAACGIISNVTVSAPAIDAVTMNEAVVQVAIHPVFISSLHGRRLVRGG
jgi:hypothetical protein